MSSFFENAPQELADAATIDGATRWQTLWGILFPPPDPLPHTDRPHFHVDVERIPVALVMVQSESMRTLPVGLAFFQGRFSSNISLMAAGAIIVALPTILIYILFQRFFIRGMLGGRSKGKRSSSVCKY